MGPEEVRAMLKVLKGGLGAEGKIAEATKSAQTAAKASVTIDKAVVKASPQLSENMPVVVAHPLNPKERFQFPPGTPEADAKRMVREIILKRARQGEEKIEIKPQLSKERVQELEQKEKEHTDMQNVIKDLESRKDLSRVQPGMYQDDNTGKYYKVTDSGGIEEVDFPKE